MYLKALSWLRCPISGSELECFSISANEDGNVITGILYSSEGGYWYPVINYVPILLIFETPVLRAFEREHGAEIASLGHLKRPDGITRPGERQVQKTFTEEWSQTGHAEITFGYEFDELVEMHRTWLYLPPEGDPSAKIIWNVGCGHGQESLALAKLYPSADIVAMDLNLSLLSAAPGLLAYPNVHMVIGSAFAPPVARRHFDHVHSQGVIHHTYNTKRAFDELEKAVAADGSLFIWVYANEDLYQRKGVLNWFRNRFRNFNDLVTRQILSRAPAPVRSAAIHVGAWGTHWLFKRRVSHADRWELKNTRHVLRDAFTPPYIKRHGFNEMIHWFQDTGFDFYVAPAGRIQEITGRMYRGVGMVGRRDGKPVIPGVVAKKNIVGV